MDLCKTVKVYNIEHHYHLYEREPQQLNNPETILTPFRDSTARLMTSKSSQPVRNGINLSIKGTLSRYSSPLKLKNSPLKQKLNVTSSSNKLHYANNFYTEKQKIVQIQRYCNTDTDLYQSNQYKKRENSQILNIQSKIYETRPESHLNS